MTAIDRDDRDSCNYFISRVAEYGTEWNCVDVTNRPRELARSDCIFRMDKCAHNPGRGGLR
jgi:hypothetical protein